MSIKPPDLPHKKHVLRKVSRADWERIGTKLYGLGFDWEFVCPSCGNVQSGKLIKERHPEAEGVSNWISSSCEGRKFKWAGCNWTLGGLLQIHTLEVFVEKLGCFIPVFNFHHPDAQAMLEEAEKRAPQVKHLESSAKTWEEFDWPEWVPAEVRASVEDFWGCFGRTPQDWLKSQKDDGAPVFGSRVTLKKLCSKDTVSGRFVYAWNNIGRVVLDNGECDCVSF